MDVEKLIRDYLAKAQVLQLATVSDGQPWVCNLHFVADEKQNLYWLSNTKRRHSQEISKDPKAAAAIAVRSPEHPVVGIQIEGRASLVEDSNEIRHAMELYDAVHGLSKDFYEEVLANKNNHKVYKLEPTLIVLFDEENFPNDPRQEWKPKG